MRRGITFGGEAFDRPAVWFGDRLQVVWLGWRRWSWGQFSRVRGPIPFRWQAFVGPVEVRWWEPRGGTGKASGGCAHTNVARRRDGSRCLDCGEILFGVFK